MQVASSLPYLYTSGRFQYSLNNEGLLTHSSPIPTVSLPLSSSVRIFTYQMKTEQLGYVWKLNFTWEKKKNLSANHFLYVWSK